MQVQILRANSAAAVLLEEVDAELAQVNTLNGCNGSQIFLLPCSFQQMGNGPSYRAGCTEASQPVPSSSRQRG